jgi:hypothetical protein
MHPRTATEAGRWSGARHPARDDAAPRILGGAVLLLAALLPAQDARDLPAAALAGSLVLLARPITLVLEAKRLETSKDNCVSSPVPKRTTARALQGQDGRLELCGRLRLSREEAMRSSAAQLRLVESHQGRSGARRQQAGDALPIGDIEVARGIQAEPLRLDRGSRRFWFWLTATEQSLEESHGSVGLTSLPLSREPLGARRLQRRVRWQYHVCEVPSTHDEEVESIPHPQPRTTKVPRRWPTRCPGGSDLHRCRQGSQRDNPSPTTGGMPPWSRHPRARIAGHRRSRQRVQQQKGAPSKVASAPRSKS